MKHYFSKLHITFLCFILPNYLAKRYDNYTLYRGIPTTTKHLKFFQELEKNFDVIFWRDPSKLNGSIEFTIPPEQKDQFQTQALQEDVYLTTIMEDVQKAFDKQSVKSYVRRNTETFNWRDYFRIKDIYDWIRDLCNNYPHQLTCLSIGKSYEKRNIRAVKVYLKDGPVHRPTVIVEGGIHAREWISPAFVTYFLNQIINSPKSTNSKLKLIGSYYEWIFIPVLNPDGYEYSHTTDRLWRKNRRGPGVDLNRNFGFKFGTAGVSSEPNSPVFCGFEPFSEPESAAMKKFLEENSQHLDYYLTFHSYGQYIMIPYAYTTKYMENFLEVRKIGREAVNQIFTSNGENYTVGTSYETDGRKLSGTSAGWAKAKHRVPYAMTFELRDKGNYGFTLPAEQILPTCREIMLAMIVILTPKDHTHDRAEKYGFSPLNLKSSQGTRSLVKELVLFNIVLSIIL